MFADFLIQRYFLIAQDSPADEDVWKLLLEEFLEEAALFGYHPRVKHELRQIFYLSKKQRNIVFPMLLKPLTVFGIRSSESGHQSAIFICGSRAGLKTNTAFGRFQRFITCITMII